MVSRMSACLISLVLLAVFLPGMSLAQSATATTRSDDELSLPLYKSGILDLNQTPSQISVGNPGIADILVLRGRQVHVIAKALGSTNVVFWDNSGRIFATVDIEVTHDLDSLKQKLFTLLPAEKIGVFSAQEKLILNGSVSSAANLQAALDIADSYLPECIDSVSGAASGDSDAIRGSGTKDTNEEGCEKAKLVNMMSVGGSQQIMLEVKVAEISRSFMREMDSDFNVVDVSSGGNATLGAVSGGAQWPNAVLQGDGELPFTALAPIDGSISPINVVDKFDPSIPSITDTGIFFSKLAGNTFYQLALEMSRAKGLSKILAEPNLTTMTGKRAKFVSGGEFPITVVTDDGITVIYKEFGVIVDFIPTILDDQRISLDLEVGVSELDFQGIDGGFPLIVKRSASSTVELKNGQTIGIAGLIQDNLDEFFSKYPGLGDVPILGHLFRSQTFRSDQSELVIFVTPHLAQPLSPDLIKLPTDSFVPPNDFEFYVLGKMNSVSKPEKKSYRKQIDGGFDGVSFGHKM